MKGLLVAFMLFIQAVPYGQEGTIAIPTRCYPREILVAQLENEFGEKQAWLASTDSPYHVVEKFNNLERHTYTLFLTDNNGTSCLLFMGRDEQFFFPVNPNGNSIKD